MFKKKPVVENFPDPVTGENIQRIKIPEDLLKRIENKIRDFSSFSNQFQGLSSQVVDMQEKQRELRREIVKTDMQVREELQFTCRELGVEPKDNWTFNMQLKMLELRTPPNVLTQVETIV